MTQTARSYSVTITASILMLFISAAHAADVELELLNAGDAFRVTQGGDDRLRAGGNGEVTINNSYMLPSSDGTTDQVMTTDGGGNVSWQNAGGDNNWTISGNDMYNNNPGFVGIGTSTPGQELDLVGNLKLENTISADTGVIYKGIFPFIHDFRASGAGNNLFVGENAGNFTMSGTGSLQTSLNTGIGSGALARLTTGYNNTAVGVQALVSNTTGWANVAIGNFANGENKTGSKNTLIGHLAGLGSPGSNPSGNVLIGYMAGYTETGSDKLYIENSDSSTPLIGGDFTADEVYLNGDVGIGTMSPNSALQVSGYVQLDLTTGSTPPAADCDAASEYGRMKVDDLNDLLYICTQSGWISK